MNNGPLQDVTLLYSGTIMTKSLVNYWVCPRKR